MSGFGAALGGGGGVGAAVGFTTVRTGTGVPARGAAGGVVDRDPAAAFLGAGVGTDRFAAATVFFTATAFEGFTGAAFRAGADGPLATGLRFTEAAFAAGFFTALFGRRRDAGFFAGLRAVAPAVRFAGGGALRRLTAALGRSVVGFFRAAFPLANADLLDAGRAPERFAGAFFRSDEVPGRPLPGAAFFGAGRGVRRAGFVRVRDLAMVRAR